MPLYRPELARTYEQYFGEKGGAAAAVAHEILPVVIADDSSKGPYPPYRPWQAGGIVSPVAGVYPRAGIQNGDGFPFAGGLLGTSGVPRSVVVVDWLQVIRDATVGGEIFVGITHHNLFPLTDNGVSVEDAAPEKDPTAGSTRPKLGNVFYGERQVNAVGILGNANVIPGGTGTLATANDPKAMRFDGPWILGPGQILLVERNLANSGFTVSFRGRYYPAP